ncbi:hypothetical protein PI95_033260 [Hassallia byssoidea VB512170]|uniref:Glycosyltransferase RgtA/B/C/D-like domain-containing protein n=1 Tax=Hassallia byssoidea VB512170 TaxID=1304833 RepID=A0A846HKS3_9CYAN|nr:glycosyltransferase family 39 protein [Hassalia byssoidea]NEU77228.1 hypothetical protein [Hassalia byssoidea VB512170]
MNSNLPPVWAFPPKVLRFLVIVLLVLGVFFRFVNIERKVYWFDETLTSLRISGYTMSETVGQVCTGQEIGVKDLQKYQRLTPEKTLTDTINSFVVENAQHPPLYYVLSRFWAQLFGSSVAVIRSLSAIISLLVFPCIYWLCLELFESSFVGWVAVALIAVSPFHVLYAQEAREYSLWTVTILLSSATLLRAMRVETKFSWLMYAISVALGLYTFLFSVLVTIAHGVYVFVIERFRFTQRVIAYLLASLLGFLAFTPWLVIVITNLGKVNETTDWTSNKIPNLSLIKSWIVNLSYFFIDFNYDLRSVYNDSVLKLIVKFLIPVILILVGYSIYFLCRNTQQRIWLFILILIGVTALPLAMPDLILGGVRSQASRYLIPTYLGIQLAVAYLLATQIISTVNNQRQKLWQLVTVTLISAGVMSCAISSQAETWWLKALNIYTPQMVRIINQTANPLLIVSCEGSSSIGHGMFLSHVLAPKVRLRLVNESNVAQISDNFSNSFSDVFLYNPDYNTISQVFLDKLENQHKYKIEKNIYPENFALWKLSK